LTGVKREQIERRLTEELEQAKSECDRLRNEFRIATIDFSSGLPHPQGIDRIRIAVAYRSAVESYLCVMKDFNGFVIDGIVPERFKNDRTRAAG
jgi:hypothetical protein